MEPFSYNGPYKHGPYKPSLTTEGPYKPSLTTEDIKLFERLVAIAKDHRLRSFSYNGITAEFMPQAYPSRSEASSTGIPRGPGGVADFLDDEASA